MKKHMKDGGALQRRRRGNGSPSHCVIRVNVSLARSPSPFSDLAQVDNAPFSMMACCTNNQVKLGCDLVRLFIALHDFTRGPPHSFLPSFRPRQSAATDVEQQGLFPPPFNAPQRRSNAAVSTGPLLLHGWAAAAAPSPVPTCGVGRCRRWVPSLPFPLPGERGPPMPTIPLPT